jgi:hypothetical protein
MWNLLKWLFYGIATGCGLLVLVLIILRWLAG